MEWIRSSAAGAAEDVADRISAWAGARALGKEGGALLLPTGTTPLLLYAALRERAAAGALDRSAWRSFNLDEYWPCAREDTFSFHRFMKQELFDPLCLLERQIGFLEGRCPQAQVELHCAAYEAEIAAAGGIDLAVLGLGVNGHLAFNEPGAEFASRTRKVELSETTRTRPGFPGGADGPGQALTVGLGTLLEAKEIVVLAFGAAKRDALMMLQRGSASKDCPATCLLEHDQVRVYTDLESL